MSRAPLHALIWSAEQLLYGLYTRGQLKLQFRPAEENDWLTWLREATSFAFHGASGRLNVYQEQRPRGGAYWYAYHTKEGRTRKRYLGQTESLSLTRLEETARMLSHPQQPTTSTEQGMMLLSSRLASPRLPNTLVERQRLLTALDEALTMPLTLLAASAGWGKTTLLSAWAHRQKKAQVAWLSPDELDNSPARFWVALIAALRRCPGLAANFGEIVVAQLQSPQPPPLSSCLSVLLHELENQQVYPAPIVLIVDDYQVIEDSAIHQGLAFFLEHLPTYLHLILSSRVDPDLPLARLRAHGQLTEIRADELRFQEGEARQFLDKMLSPPLSKEESQRLVSRTEGWIAGLHLVALTMQKRENRTAYLETLTGSQRYLLDYVQEDILARLSPDTRDFLLHISILSRLDAAVCQTVTAAPTKAASQHMLTLLERANLFLVPLDEERHIYRLHDLFREALLSALHTSQPEMVSLLHHRAASFYEADGQWHEAIAHALAAADYSTAVRLMEQTVEQFWLRGEAETMARWVLALPETLVREHARLTLTTALYLLNTITQMTREQRESRHQQVRQLMARVETALRAEIDELDQESSATDTGATPVASPRDREAQAAEDALLHRRLRLLHMHLVFFEAVANGDHERLNRMQQEIEEALEQDEEAIWQMVPLLGSFLLNYTVRIEGGRLVPLLLSAKRRVDRKASRYASIKVRQWLAQAAVEAGQLHLAFEECQAALDQIEQREGYALLRGYPQIILAMVLYQWNHLEEARSLLQTVLQDASTWQHLDLLAWGYTDLLQVELARGDCSAAQQALHGMEQLVQRERYWTYSDQLPIRRVQWWLAQRQLETVSDWVAGVVFPQGVWEDKLYYAFPLVIRVYFAKLLWREALELLECWHAHLDRPDNIRITLTFLAQLLVALHQTGQNDQARVVAARLFALTEPEGYLRVYLDEGEPMRQALEVLLTLHSPQYELAFSTRTFISKLLAAFEQGQQGAGASLAAPPPPSALPSAQQASAIFFAPGVSLTRREQEVLRLLSIGASNQEIARTLVIALPTVKKHVSNLLDKLQASSRTQAISRARALSLLE